LSKSSFRAGKNIVILASQMRIISIRSKARCLTIRAAGQHLDLIIDVDGLNEAYLSEMNLADYRVHPTMLSASQIHLQ